MPLPFYQYLEMFTCVERKSEVDLYVLHSSLVARRDPLGERISFCLNSERERKEEVDEKRKTEKHMVLDGLKKICSQQSDRNS